MCSVVFFFIENAKQFAGRLLLCEFFANYCAANFAPAPRQDEFEPSELSAPPLLLSPCGSFRLGLNEFYWIRHLLYFFFWWQVKSLLLQLEKNSNKLIYSIILMLILLSAHFSYAMLGSFLHLKGTVSRDIYFLIFFCSTNPSVPLIDMLKYIRMWLQFCGDIRVKSWNFLCILLP